MPPDPERRMRVSWGHRPPTAPHGRFGGGWQWALGFRASRRTLLVELFVATLRIDWVAKPRDLYGRPETRRGFY